MKKIWLFLSFSCFVLVLGILGYSYWKNDQPSFSDLQPEPYQVATIGPKYSMAKRFGIGFVYCWSPESSSCENLYSFPGLDQLASWFVDWHWNGRLSDPEARLEYLALVGGYHKDNLPSTTTYGTSCDQIKSVITQQGKSKYPDYMLWTIGNEIGSDDDRSAQDYAEAYVAWRQCLKSINPTFLVGSGAVAMMNVVTPSRSHTCVDYDDSRSGKNYFRAYLNTINTNYGAAYLPDFIVNHVYTVCRGTTLDYSAMTDISLFRENIRHQRLVLKELGLEKKDLFIKEFSTLGSTSDANTVLNYLDQTVRYLATAGDAQLGNPDDENRLVQRWAWHLMNDSSGVEALSWSPQVALIHSSTKQRTSLGQRYIDLKNYYMDLENQALTTACLANGSCSQEACKASSSIRSLTTKCSLKP